jgi:GR25 family glycosyltransferase involved in LPS biosynthesis
VVAINGIVGTLVGNGPTQYSPISTSGTGSGILLNNPRGVAVDASGCVYISDTGNHRICKVTSGGNLITLAGSTAIDGSTLSLSKLISENIIGNIGIKSIKNQNRIYHYELPNINAVGCFLSHYNIWKLILNTEGDNFIIFEDDTQFNDISLIEINYRVSLLPNNWDIYLLSNNNFCYSRIKINKNLFKIKRFFLTNSYIINKKGIKKIFNSNTLFPINQQIDSYLSDLTDDFNLNIYCHNNYKYYKQSQDFITDIQDNAVDLYYDRCLISYPSYNNKENL